MGEQRQFESVAENKIEVPERVGRYHPLVRKARVALRAEQDSDREGRSSPRLDIQVSPKSRRRALRIRDTLIKALESRGMSVSLDAQRGSTLVDVSGTSVPIRLGERYQQVENRSPRYKRQPTGKLALKIDTWTRDVRKTSADGRSSV